MDLNLLNEWFKDTYVEEVINEVNKHYNTTKWRFMKLTSERRAYSYHRDETKRLFEFNSTAQRISRHGVTVGPVRFTKSSHKIGCGKLTR